MARFGFSILAFGILTFVLPYLDTQFVIIDDIGPQYQPLIGGGAIVLGFFAMIGGMAVDNGVNYE